MSLRKPQKFLHDLYKDLDDRHLLLPVIGLVVAIIAVPLLLGTGTDSVAPSAAPPVDTDAGAVTAAVLADNAGVRDYRKRLDQLKARNPFKQQFVAQGSSGGGSGGGSGSETTEPSTGPIDVSPPGVSSGDPGGGSPSTPTTPSNTGSGSGGGGGTETVKETDTREITRLVTRRIDVLVGPKGNVKERKNVKAMTLLPSKRTPVMAFIGVDEKGKQATFAVSADVTSTGGAGRCVGGGPIACEFVNLEVGEQQMFEYGPEGRIYRLRVTKIANVEVRLGGKGRSGR